MCVCVCVCVCERERERGGEGGEGCSLDLAGVNAKELNNQEPNCQSLLGAMLLTAGLTPPGPHELINDLPAPMCVCVCVCVCVCACKRERVSVCVCV